MYLMNIPESLFKSRVNKYVGSRQFAIRKCL